jgi:hypothetical protein
MPPILGCQRIGQPTLLASPGSKHSTWHQRSRLIPGGNQNFPLEDALESSKVGCAKPADCDRPAANSFGTEPG